MNPEEIGTNLTQYDFTYYMEQALEHVPDDVDTREGSIIYDALAPACHQLAGLTMELRNVMLETFVTTASGKYLDLRAEEAGVRRIRATKAIVKAAIEGNEGQPYELDIGTRFSSISENPTYYTVTDTTEVAGEYLLEADETGLIGNEYIGTILPIDNLNDFGQAKITEISIPAREDETDDDLRKRVSAEKGIGAFGGNIEDYTRMATGIDGVGGVQVYPIWKGGGTVLLVLQDNVYRAASQTLIREAEALIDPPVNSGQGLGLAPIGHKVTVVAPDERIVNVSFNLDVEPGYSQASIMPSIISAIEKYFNTVRIRWGQRNDSGYSSWVYRSQIISAILANEGVANVSGIRLNGREGDLQMFLTNDLQELPVLGEVSVL